MPDTTLGSRVRFEDLVKGLLAAGGEKITFQKAKSETNQGNILVRVIGPTGKVDTVLYARKIGIAHHPSPGIRETITNLHDESLPDISDENTQNSSVNSLFDEIMNEGS